MPTGKSRPEALDESMLENVAGGGAASAVGGSALFGSDGGVAELPTRDALASWKTTVDNLAIGGRVRQGAVSWPAKW